MRLAIYHNLPSGGGKRALFEMARRLAMQHQVDVYTLSTAEHDFCDLRPFVRRHIVFPFEPLPLVRRPFGRLNQGIRTADLLRLEAVQRRVAAQIDGGGYDVVFVHHCRFGQSPGLLKFLRTPSVYYCQEPPRQIYEPLPDRPYAHFSKAQRLGNLVDPLPGLYRRTLAKVDLRNVRAARLVLVNSAYSRESLYRAYGIFARVCYLGVDTERFYPLSENKGDFVLSVGALNPRKGFDFLIHSLAQLDGTCRPRLVLVSNHTDERELSFLVQLAERLGVRVEFRRMIGDDELLNLYNRAIATVYAPVMEPFGFVPLESMACGTPVVGVREAGVRESVVHGVTGILTERHPAEFARALHSLLVDRNLAHDLGQNGVRHVRQHWTWEAAVERIENNLIAAAGLANPLAVQA
ncbi:MAG: glycosyltransferase family 4 protein [candidate division KSB1 bacterium]|nr:glycosyltransferase family 4 protein [candidate division KSB1 bacterium]